MGPTVIDERNGAHWARVLGGAHGRGERRALRDRGQGERRPVFRGATLVQAGTIALVAAVVGGSTIACSPRISAVYYEAPYAAMVAEPVRSAVEPLARDVHWIYDSDGSPDPLRCAEGPPAPAARITDPSRQRAQALSSLRAELTSRATRATMSRERTEELGPMLTALCAAEVDDLVRVTLVEPGYVGPDAPPGSALFLELFAVDAKSREFRGDESVVGITMTLVQDGDTPALAAWRGWRIHGYRRRPKAVPEGFVDPKASPRPVEYDQLSWWSFALMVRSAVGELGRARAAGGGWGMTGDSGVEGTP
ncbi:MAG: hypothetical protein AAGF11_29135 [Myxococcota bacterium]